MDLSSNFPDSTIAHSSNFVLLTNGVLNIYDNLTERDCRSILKSGELSSIQFGRRFEVSDKTFELINRKLLTIAKAPYLRLILNGFDAVDNLDCFAQLPNLKFLLVDMFKNDQLDKINRYLKLKSLRIAGNGISIRPIVEQTELEEISLAEKLKDIEVIGSMKNLKRVSFTKVSLKNLDFLLPLKNLEELHFMLGSAPDCSRLPEIGKIKKLSFTLVPKLTIENLLPINRMKFLKELEFRMQPHLFHLDWLTNKKIKTKVVKCKNFKQ
ncbi:hypothetical protein [Leptospira stimsonii]|uniref:Leucine-rich repeat domain-containing protein n=1 Tax=Leptospira stimsonii TaxID=2202203 RepID=A0ABY2MX81_9LEPT|nr:hypothetical protein [Leptospira stimsonii]TGK20339.1 hypothetical protein EHO98_09895 [Leptospira stimsonii]TGM10927.1 hypothetical protein EHQ90_17705 [Leptospira stimsonii]